MFMFCILCDPLGLAMEVCHRQRDGESDVMLLVQCLDRLVTVSVTDRKDYVFGVLQLASISCLQA